MTPSILGAMPALLALLGVQDAAGRSARPAPVDASRAAGIAEHRAQCAGKDGWSDPAPPIRIFAGIYDVGTCGIVVLLVTGPAGHVLIDAATEEAAPAVLGNMARLGVRASDVKMLLTSHEHLDHVGGLRAVQRATGATLVATAAARPGLESGMPSADDPQRGGLPPFPGVRVGRVVRDGEVIRLGPLAFTAHATPGHAPGSTSWSWRACEGATCRSVVYADSLNSVAAEGYRFSDHPAYLATFRDTIARVARLRCDLVVTPHPANSRLYERLAGAEPLASEQACTSYAQAASGRLATRLASEAAAPAPAR